MSRLKLKYNGPNKILILYTLADWDTIRVFAKHTHAQPTETEFE